MIEQLLWPHQNDSIKMLIQYLNDFRDKKTNQAALVQMPTGSGKSGIITYVTRCLPEIGLTIVLTPRISLRNQLSLDISQRFFEHINYKTGDQKKTVKVITDSDRKTPDIISDNEIVVMTIQMIVSIEKSQHELFDFLASRAELLVIDEGHYEPANEWRKTIRKIRSPKVIFTATPFRNDFKVFDIDKRYCYILTLKNAQDGKYLRKVEFVDRLQTSKKSPANFIDDILEFYDTKFADLKEKPKVIIRCDDSSSIRHLACELIRRGRTVVGIHETFCNYDWERKHVPNTDEETAIFWIHQYKLLEGIDDYRFQVLAIYEKISNARSLVQQIGRIIRNPNRLENQTGYVLEHWGDYHRKLWEGFINCDTQLTDMGVNTFGLSSGHGILEEIIKIQPKIYYIDGRFRSQFEFEKIDPLVDIKVPLKANLLQKASNFDIDTFVYCFLQKCEERDCAYHIYKNIAKNVRVVLYISMNNSGILTNHTFIETQLGLYLVCEYDEHVCVYDSQNARNVGYEADCTSLEARRLKKLFSQQESTKLTAVHLLNSNLGTSTVRSKSITAYSIESVAPSFDDYAQVCTIAEGYIDDAASQLLENKHSKRYVGFSRGRITQNCTVLLPQYLEWLSRLKDVLDSKTRPNNVLSRYAVEANIPAESKPISVLFEDVDIEQNYALCNNDEIKLNLIETCIDVKDGKFTLRVNESEFEASIEFSGDKYVLTCDEIDEKYFCTNDVYPRSPIKYLNSSQAFRVLPEDFSVIYIGGQFYNPAIKIGSGFKRNNYSLGHCFIPENTIGTCKTEKGSKDYYDKHNDKWDPDSLFGIISELGERTRIKEQFGNPDIVICDDVGIEIADFICCDTKIPRVIFIHAKAYNSDYQTNCSTSSLHDICSQAVKNLGYFAMFNDITPSKIDSWSCAWTAKVNGGQGMVKSRILKNEMGLKPKKIWDTIRKCINNPLVEKEVWLFLGNILSQEYFEREMGKTRPAPNVIQAAYLLHATMADVASVGAKLKLFCME